MFLKNSDSVELNRKPKVKYALFTRSADTSRSQLR